MKAGYVTAITYLKLLNWKHYIQVWHQPYQLFLSIS